MQGERNNGWCRWEVPCKRLRQRQRQRGVASGTGSNCRPMLFAQVGATSLVMRLIRSYHHAKPKMRVAHAPADFCPCLSQTVSALLGRSAAGTSIALGSVFQTQSSVLSLAAAAAMPSTASTSNSGPRRARPPLTGRRPRHECRNARPPRSPRIWRAVELACTANRASQPGPRPADSTAFLVGCP